MPTLRALECFVAVLDHGSVTEAASRLHLSQPALSHQLAALEREIGAPLLQRLPRGVRPTVAGRAVAVDARAALAAAAAVTRVGRAVAAGSAGRVRLACAESMTAPLLAPALAEWKGSHPGVSVELTEFASADLLADHLRNDRADLGLGPRPSRWQGQTVAVGREEVVLVVPPGHPLGVDDADRTLAAVAAYPVIGFTADNGLASWLDGLAAGAGVRLEPVLRTRSAGTAADLACAGLGVALVPGSAVGDRLAGQAVPLNPPLDREVVVLVSDRADPVVDGLVSTIVRRGVPVTTWGIFH